MFVNHPSEAFLVRKLCGRTINVQKQNKFCCRELIKQKAASEEASDAEDAATEQETMMNIDNDTDSVTHPSTDKCS